MNSTLAWGAAKAQAEEAVRFLIQQGLVGVYLRANVHSKEIPIPRDDPRLGDEVFWLVDPGPGQEILIATTESGENVVNEERL